jgi:hypothetical protein
MHKQLDLETQPRVGSGLGVILALTIFVSAFLLFQVQPLISKFILPWFGGSPAVWTTAMLFFQCVLFAGYAYAHLTSRLFNLKQQARIHLGILLLASLVAWLIIPSDVLKPTGDENPTWRILTLLSVCVGVPYFTLATTGPLIQAWFSHAYPGKSPYRLYSLSNIGSLLALLSFPYLFEPYFKLNTMGYGWTLGFWIFAGCCLLAAMRVLRLKLPATDAPVADEPAVEHEVVTKPKTWQQIAWVFLPFVASMMFIATTDHVSHDVAPEPRLWITTLSLYLLTFIICFDHERWYKREIIAPLCIFSILFLTVATETNWLDDRYGLELSMSQTRWLHFITMFLICLVCHGELVRLRPHSHAYLTEFYLGMSAGGACGGLFISLIATNFFSDYWEWTLGLMIAILVCMYALVTTFRQNLRESAFEVVTFSLGTITAAAMGLVGYLNDPFSMNVRQGTEFSRTILNKSRNFYGTTTVLNREHRNDPSESFRVFYSGNIQHGMQFTHPDKRQLPTSYFGHASGSGETFLYAQQKLPAMRVAVVGLGVGTLACYARETDEYDFYEINPEVERIAREHFWYLNDCKAKNRVNGQIPVILGDARLKLEALPEDVKYDIIALDAFSGDSVPVHLLTEEAFAIYMKHLKPNGYIVVNITNTYLNLFPVVKRQVEYLTELDTAAKVQPPMNFRHKYHPGDYDKLIYRSHYFVLTRDTEYLAAYPSVARPKHEADERDKPVIGTVIHDNPDVFRWTDNFSSINAIEFKGELPFTKSEAVTSPK